MDTWISEPIPEKCLQKYFPIFSTQANHLQFQYFGEQ